MADFDTYLSQVQQAAGGRLDAESARELRAHFEEVVAELRTAGRSPEEAEVAAVVALGRAEDVAAAFRHEAPSWLQRLAGGPAAYVAPRGARDLRLLAAATVAAAALAYGYGRSPWVEPRWTASAIVQITSRLDYGNWLRVSRQVPVLAEEARQPEVFADAASNLQVNLPVEALRARVRTTPLVDQHAIRIEVDDVDPARAEAVAAAIGRAYATQHNVVERMKLREEQSLMSLDPPSSATLDWYPTGVLVPAAALGGLVVAAAGLAARTAQARRRARGG